MRILVGLTLGFALLAGAEPASQQQSAVAIATYTIIPQPQLSIVAGVATITAPAGTYVCYLLSTAPTGPAQLPLPDGKGSCVFGTLYTAPVSVTASQVIYATASAAAGNALMMGSYAVGVNPVAAAPTFTPGAGSYGSYQRVYVTTTTPGAIVWCSGTGERFAVCPEPYILGEPGGTVYAYATAPGYTQSDTVSALYVISAN
jgi:hypothetical protein